MKRSVSILLSAFLCLTGCDFGVEDDAQEAGEYKRVLSDVTLSECTVKTPLESYENLTVKVSVSDTLTAVRCSSSDGSVVCQKDYPGQGLYVAYVTASIYSFIIVDTKYFTEADGEDKYSISSTIAREGGVGNWKVTLY